ncbi:unnamed protein product, partial [marine sediment metagenome]
MKRVKRKYKDFWAERFIIKFWQAAAGDDMSAVYRREADFMKEVLGLAAGSRVLDLGCGRGDHCLALAEQGIAATGIDVAP